MSTTPSNFKDKPDKELTLVQRLCKQGKHRIRSTSAGLDRWCTRPGCGYDKEYD